MQNHKKGKRNPSSLSTAIIVDKLRWEAGGLTVSKCTVFLPYSSQGPVVRKVDNAINWINLYLLDSTTGFLNACPQDSDLSGG